MTTTQLLTTSRYSEIAEELLNQIHTDTEKVIDVLAGPPALGQSLD